MPKDPFEGIQEQEALNGESIIIGRTEKKTIIRDHTGKIVWEIITKHQSRPDANGCYIESEESNIILDPAGNPITADLRSLKGRSHSGLTISSQDQLAYCNSIFHTTPNRKILLGQDGSETPKGAICSHCEHIKNSLYLALLIICIGVIFGLFSGVGFF